MSTLSPSLSLSLPVSPSLSLSIHTQVDAQTHYEAERLELTQQITAESELVRDKRLDIGFLSFSTERDAQQ